MGENVIYLYAVEINRKFLGGNNSRNFADRDTDARESFPARHGNQIGHDRRQSGNFDHNDRHFSPNRDNNGQGRFNQDFNQSGHIRDRITRDQFGHNNRGGLFGQDGDGQGQQHRGPDQRIGHAGHPGKQIGRGSWQGGNIIAFVNYVSFAILSLKLPLYLTYTFKGVLPP